MIYPCLLRHAPKATKLCLQSGVELVGVCSGRSSGSFNS
jgi:hypothetical protein